MRCIDCGALAEYTVTTTGKRTTQEPRCRECYERKVREDVAEELEEIEDPHDLGDLYFDLDDNGDPFEDYHFK